MPGYVLFGLAIYGLLRAARPGARRCDPARRSRARDRRVARGPPHPRRPDTRISKTRGSSARLAVSAYPAAAIFLVGLAAQLAFARMGHNVSLLLVLVGTAGLVVGDVVWAFSEIGRLELPEGLLEIPYMIVPRRSGWRCSTRTCRAIGRGDHTAPSPRSTTDQPVRRGGDSVDRARLAGHPARARSPRS